MFFRNLFQQPDVAEITPEETRARQQAGAVIVDVRELHEWHSGHIPGATHMPLGTLSHRVHELDKAREIIAVCRSGHRSLMAAQTLQRAGFTRVSSMAGGMLHWTQKHFPIKK